MSRRYFALIFSLSIWVKIAIVIEECREDVCDILLWFLVCRSCIYFNVCVRIFNTNIFISFSYLHLLRPSIRGGNRAGRVGLGRANTGPGQNRAGLKLVRFFRAKILTAQPALKTGPVGPNSHLRQKKIRPGRAGPGHTGLGHTGPGQIWPGFFRVKNLMAQPGPNFGRTGLAHRAGPIFPPLPSIQSSQ